MSLLPFTLACGPYDRTEALRTGTIRPEGMDLGTSRYTLPCLHADLDEVDELFGGDPWPYGLEPNRTALEALLGFLVQQGFLSTAPPVEDLFAPVVTSNE